MRVVDRLIAPMLVAGCVLLFAVAWWNNIDTCDSADGASDYVTPYTMCVWHNNADSGGRGETLVYRNGELVAMWKG